MTRRRREVSPEGGSSADAAPAAEGPGPQATLTVRGSAESVKKQLGIGADQHAENEKKKNANGHDDEKQKFTDSLRNPQFVIRIKRQSPRALAGHCWDAECPIQYTKLQDETREGWGGGTYRAVIMDPDLNKTVTADTFEIPGEPITPETELTAEENEKLFMRGAPKSTAEMTIDGLSRRAEVTAKMLEVEGLEAQLEDARKRRGGQEKPVPQDDQRIQDLDRRLVEAKHQAELEARDRKHAEEMRELKAMIERNSKPAKPEGPSETAMILQQMQKAQEAADKRFEALQKQMQDDKMNLLLEEVKSIKNKPNPQSGSLLEQAEAMLKLKTLFGWGGDEADDEEDDADDPDDKRPWWEKALDKLGGKLGDKLFEKFSNLEEKGEKVDREKFMLEMSQHADEVAAEAIAKHQRRGQVPPAPRAPGLPPPPPPAAAVPPAGVPAVQVPLPPPPPPAPPPAVPVEGAVGSNVEAVPQASAKLTIEQEIVIRVGGVLEMIEREMELRPNEYHWTYEGCFNSLPESILEKVCAAADPVTMIDAFAIQYISADVIASMKEKISGNPKILAWIKTGHDELKLWYAQKQEDPTFDPFAEEEGEGE